MTDLKHFGEACIGVFIAFACLARFFWKSDYAVLRRTPPPPLYVRWDRETSKVWAMICGGIALAGLILGIMILWRNT